jgi:hypothetical protein
MALRDKLIERVQPLLDQGETIQQVMPAQQGQPWLMGFGLLGAMFVKPRILAVTDKRIVLFSAGRMAGTQPKEKVAEAPRQTKLAPSGAVWLKTTLAGQTVYVHRRFKKDVEAADAALSS